MFMDFEDGNEVVKVKLSNLQYIEFIKITKNGKYERTNIQNN